MAEVARNLDLIEIENRIKDGEYTLADVPALVAEVRRLRAEAKAEFDIATGYMAERDALRAQRDAALALHQPEADRPGSLVTWRFCSCGAMETFTASDGYPAIGPAPHPCATARALGVTD